MARPVNKRTDIWAFGCVLFEMLTGTRAFEGTGTSDTIAAILRSEPDWTRLGPRRLNRSATLLKRCLEKDPHDDYATSATRVSSSMRQLRCARFRRATTDRRKERLARMAA